MPFVSLDRFTSQCENVRRACETEGRDPDSLVYSIALVACVRLDYPTRASTSHTGHLFWRAEQGGRTVISYPECLLVSVEFGKTVAQFQIP